MSKYDVIHETGSTSLITTPPWDDRATATGNMQKKLGKDRTCISEDLIMDSQTHRHTDRQTDTVITILRFPIGRGVITFQKLESITISLFLFNKFTVA